MSISLPFVGIWVKSELLLLLAYIHGTFLGNFFFVRSSACVRGFGCQNLLFFFFRLFSFKGIFDISTQKCTFVELLSTMNICLDMPTNYSCFSYTLVKLFSRDVSELDIFTGKFVNYTVTTARNMDKL